MSESVAEGFGFLERLREDWLRGANRFSRSGEAFFAAHRRGRLVGVCGLNRDPFTGDGSVGRLRRLYVRPGERRGGIGRALTEAALAHAGPRFLVVRLRTRDPAAARFYLALGFSEVDSDPVVSHELRLGLRA